VTKAKQRRQNSIGEDLGGKKFSSSTSEEDVMARGEGEKHTIIESIKLVRALQIKGGRA